MDEQRCVLNVSPQTTNRQQLSPSAMPQGWKHVFVLCYNNFTDITYSHNNCVHILFFFLPTNTQILISSSACWLMLKANGLMTREYLSLHYREYRMEVPHRHQPLQRWMQTTYVTWCQKSRLAPICCTVHLPSIHHLNMSILFTFFFVTSVSN